MSDLVKKSEDMDCCNSWTEATGKIISQGPASLAYPPSMQPSAQIEYSDGWHVNGCCGGGCYVLNDLKFCPWCGSKKK